MHVDDVKEPLMPVITRPASATHELPGARFTTLASPSCGSAETALWTVEVLPGAEPVPHRLTREEIFIALGGEARATLDGVAHRVREGDALVLPPGVDFSIVATGEVPFRAVVCLPVGGQAVLPGGEPFTPPWAL
jgi:quercetin dioxygenase-like cupin family protein